MDRYDIQIFWDPKSKRDERDRKALQALNKKVAELNKQVELLNNDLARLNKKPAESTEVALPVLCATGLSLY